MKRWWLTIALLLSLGMNLGILATLALRGGEPAASEAVDRPVPAHRGPIERLASHLGLEGEKRSEFVAIQTEFLGTVQRSRLEIERHRRELRAVLISRRPDAEEAHRLLAEMRPAQQAMDRAFVDAVLASRELLDRRQERAYFTFLGRLRRGDFAPRPGDRRPPGATRPSGRP